MSYERAIVVVNKTRLENLIERFNTKPQARFYIEHAGGDFKEYEAEHDAFHRALEQVEGGIYKELKVKVIERRFVPNYLFSEKDLVVVVGQDGLVANTAKYVGDLPILAINPDPSRLDGVLLPFHTDNFKTGLRDVLAGKARMREITLAETKSSDGQRLLAFNDFFIGPASHTSARYKLNFKGFTEKQSSSGIIVSTGAGSSGWLSSVMNMAQGVSQTFAEKTINTSIKYRLPWDTDRLAFVVREPFLSKHSGVSVSAGFISESETLSVESEMPNNGIIFSDGVEADFITFNSGTKVKVGIARQRARLIIRDKQPGRK